MSGLEVIIRQLENKMKNCFQTVNGDDNLNKQDLIDKGYKHVCTQNSESKNDFIHKFKIAAKEIEETNYWLLLCKHSENYPECDDLLEQLKDIENITNKIIITLKISGKK